MGFQHLVNLSNKEMILLSIDQLTQISSFHMNRAQKSIFFFLCLFLFSSCHEKSNKVFPFIIVERKDDSLKIGEVFEAKIFLSDTSYYQIIDEQGKRRNIYPVFKVNGKIIDNKSDTLFYTENVDSIPLAYSYKNIRESAFSIIFPHPTIGEGTIEVSKRIGYIVED
jgi:hypothetical protein